MLDKARIKMARRCCDSGHEAFEKGAFDGIYYKVALIWFSFSYLLVPKNHAMLKRIISTWLIGAHFLAYDLNNILSKKEEA